MQVAEITEVDKPGKFGPLKGKCCVKPGEYIKGTYFLGGAGLNGLYIPKLIGAFHQAGIKREYISNLLYILALLLLVGEGIELIFSFREFILAGKGIGVYGVLIYYAIAFLSAILWGLSYLVSKNIKLAIIFWGIFITLTVFLAVQPSWWAAP